MSGMPLIDRLKANGKILWLPRFDSGSAGNKMIGNIYSWAVFNNIFLNTLQSIDFDLKMKECASRGC